jgi:hypothetical protein
MQEDTNMLTKVAIALLGTIGTAAVGGVASANEMHRMPPVIAPVAVTVAAPAPIRVTYPGNGGYQTPGVYYRNDRREEARRIERARLERERLERERFERQRLQRERQAREHAEWLRLHGGHVYGRR